MGFFSPGRIARYCAGHPWLTLGAWAVLLAGAMFAATNINLTDEQVLPGSESYRADQLLEDRMRGPSAPIENIIVHSETMTVDDARFEELVASIVADLRRLPESIAAVASFYETGDAGLVSPDRHKTIISVVLTGSRSDAMDTVEPMLEAVERHETEGFRLLTVGPGSMGHDWTETAENDLSRAEKFGLPLALLVLVLVFGAGVAAGIPIALALLSIVVSVGITALISQVVGLNTFTTSMITMIGLAVGIDYTLFILERVREERRHGLGRLDAIEKAGNTSSRAVLFSGFTVLIALTGLLIVPSNMFQALSFGAMTAVFSAVLAALTLLPAVLGLLGDRVNWLRLPGRSFKPTDHASETGFFARTTGIVMRHPVIAGGLAVAILVSMAIPYTRISVGDSGIEAMPSKLQSVQAFKILDAEFSAGRVSPTEIVIDGDIASPFVQGGIDRLRASLAGDPAIGGTGDIETNAEGDLAVLSVFLNGDPFSSESAAALDRLRSEHIPAAFEGTGAKVLVGGSTASSVDYIDTMDRYLPLVIGFVLTLSFLLLMLVFRSIVIPLKAIIMNLLSVGAAYGALVLVFQEGIGADFLGLTRTENISAFLPVFLFAVLFGLSMDYHVFLLSRIQERFLETHDNAGAVAYGLRSTAHIITGAAAIMVIVFGGFAMGDMVEMQQMGFGLAVAVFLDATIVRSVLVPASMELLGDRNWYFPSWLEWLPKIHVEGRAAAGEHAPAREPAYGRGPVPVSGD